MRWVKLYSSFRVKHHQHRVSQMSKGEDLISMEISELNKLIIKYNLRELLAIDRLPLIRLLMKKVEFLEHTLDKVVERDLIQSDVDYARAVILTVKPYMVAILNKPMDENHWKAVLNMAIDGSNSYKKIND